MTGEAFSASLQQYRERIKAECEARHIEDTIYEKWLEEDAPGAFIWKVPVSLFVTECKDRYIDALVRAHKVFKANPRKGENNV